jgi:hypothetical protein
MIPMSRSRTILLAASSLAALSAAAPAHAAPPAEPLVQSGNVSVLTGDFDILEDVQEHISMPRGKGNTMTHQLYDHSGATPQE